MSSGPVLHTVDLPTQLQDFRAHARGGGRVGERGRRRRPAESGASTIVSIADMEKQAILGTIRQLNGDKLMAARLLGIGKTTLYRKLKEYGLAEAVDSAGQLTSHLCHSPAALEKRPASAAMLGLAVSNRGVQSIHG